METSIPWFLYDFSMIWRTTSMYRAIPQLSTVNTFTRQVLIRDSQYILTEAHVPQWLTWVNSYKGLI